MANHASSQIRCPVSIRGVVLNLLLVLSAIYECAHGSPHGRRTSTFNETSTFRIVAQNPCDENRSLKFKAANNSLYVGSATQSACCNQLDAEDSASFFIKNEELLLYSPGNPRQRVYVEDFAAPTKGLGYVRYHISNSPLPNESKTKGWMVGDDGSLSFGDNNLFLCKNNGSVWDVVVGTGDNLQGTDGKCWPFTAEASIADHPVSCLYTGTGQTVSFFCL
ncbi:hypothetical protein DER45DRAFT_540094 [Fusarium avenaceum]|nr:hypothetical protein DER45DRAFT_540094 [Fusarium avenaceum]